MNEKAQSFSCNIMLLIQSGFTSKLLFLDKVIKLTSLVSRLPEEKRAGLGLGKPPCCLMFELTERLFMRHGDVSHLCASRNVAFNSPRSIV